MYWTQKEIRQALIELAISANKAALDINENAGCGGGLTRRSMDEVRKKIKQLGRIFDLDKEEQKHDEAH